MTYDVIETRDITAVVRRRRLPVPAGVNITAQMVQDDHNSPKGYDCYDEDDLRAFDEGDWQYVGLVVRVEYSVPHLPAGDIALAEESLWAVEHGRMGGDTEADAWEYASTVVDPSGTVHIGSALATVTEEALATARNVAAAVAALKWE